MGNATRPTPKSPVAPYLPLYVIETCRCPEGGSKMGEWIGEEDERGTSSL